MRARAPFTLLVDSELGALTALRHALASVAIVEACMDFQTARGLLLEFKPDRLVTNLRLSAFNGLHLVHLARANYLKTRSVVYAAPHSVELAHDVQPRARFTNAKNGFLTRSRRMSETPCH